jgi:two-component system response regulator HydG
VDVRVVAATNRNLRAAVAARRFREDLYFRLSVFPITIPPLRERAEDIPLLARYFVERFCREMGKPVMALAESAEDALRAYSWPGNVRELQNCIERAIALTQHDKIVVEDLPDTVRDYRRSHVIVAGDDPSELVPLCEVERRYVLRVLEAVGGNKTTASQILGVTRKTLYRKLEEYGAGEGARIA